MCLMVHLTKTKNNMNKDLLKMLNNLSEHEVTEDKVHDRVLLIDGLNLFFRNFAVINLMNESGSHVGGLGGFLRSLGTLINQIQPTSMYIIFDGTGSSTNRKNLLPEYKSNRNITRITNWDAFDNLEEESASLSQQMLRLIDYLKTLPINIITRDKLEADDVIAVVSRYVECKYNTKKVFILSGDQDFYQLGRPNVDFINYKTKKPLNFDEEQARMELHKKLLLGDKSDCIPSIFPNKFPSKIKKDLVESIEKFNEYIEKEEDIESDFYSVDAETTSEMNNFILNALTPASIYAVRTPALQNWQTQAGSANKKA